jgi:cell division protein FtsA
VVHNPIYSTGVGLVLFGTQRRDKKTYSDQGRYAGVGVKGVVGKMRSWFQGNF